MGPLLYVAKGVFLGCQHRHVGANIDLSLDLGAKAVRYGHCLHTGGPFEPGHESLSGLLHPSPCSGLPAHKEDAPGHANPGGIVCKVLELLGVSNIMDNTLNTLHFPESRKVGPWCQDGQRGHLVSALEAICAQ